MHDAFDSFRSGAQIGALARIEGDIENVRTAWKYALRVGDAKLARDYVEALWIVYEVRGWHLAGAELFEDAATRLASMPDSDDTSVAGALCTAAHSWFSALLGMPERGRELAARAVRTLRDRDQRSLALALQMQNLSLVFTDVGALRISIDEAIDAARRADDEWMETLLRTWQATCSVMEGDPQTATELGDALRRKLGDTGHQWLLTWSYQAMAGAARMQGRLTEAAALYERALVIDAESDFRRGVQYALNNLGVVFSEMSDFESADREFLRSLAISEEIGQTREILHTLCDIADVRAQLGDREEAVRLIAAAFGNPASTQLSVYRAPIHETTERLRARLEDELDENVYREAWSLGSAGGIEPLVRGLLDRAAEG